LYVLVRRACGASLSHLKLSICVFSIADIPTVSAHDPKAPYYDASSKPSDPKWSVVHVEFRSKFANQIGLKELREMGKMGSPLENMQMLKQSRLSVSQVNEAEWQYLLGVFDERGGVSKKA
jgi:predicted RNA-binding protein with PUA-like domain